MRQRILGLIILVAIALIFVPLLFSRSGSTPPTDHPGQVVTRQVSINTPPAESTPPPANLQAAQNQVIFQDNDGTGEASPPASFPAEAPTAAVPNDADADNSNSEVAANSPAINPPIPTPETDDATPAVGNTTVTPETAETTPVAAATDEPIPTESTTTADVATPPTVVETQGPPVGNNVATSESNVLQAAQQQFTHPSTAATPTTQNATGNTTTQHHAAFKTHKAAAVQEKLHAATHVAQTKIHTVAKAAGKSTAKNQGWIVQLGSFAQPEHVQKLVQQLHSRGFVAHVMPVHTTQGTITRVFIGPEAQRVQAERIAKQLQEQLAIHSLVVPI